VSDQFDSPRQALAYHFSCLGGPALSQPRFGESISTGHGAWDGPLIGALLYGPNPGRIDATTGAWGEGCGVEAGGELERELAEWALGHGVVLSPRARDIVRRLRGLMEHHGVKPVSEPARASDLERWTDPEGRTWSRLKGPRPAGR
jgi:hypothetical protein